MFRPDPIDPSVSIYGTLAVVCSTLAVVSTLFMG
jgi:hypothetical protein